MEFLFTILGTIITVVSFKYAFYTNKRFIKLEDYNREQAWDIYRQASNVVAFYQQIYNLKIDNQDLNKLNSAGEHAAIELAVDSVKMIKRFEKKYNEEEIQRWLKQGKIQNDSHLQTFRNLI